MRSLTPYALVLVPMLAAAAPEPAADEDPASQRLVVGQINASGIAVSDSEVFWGAGEPEAIHIWAAPKTGGKTRQVTRDALSSHPHHFQIAGTHLYFVIGRAIRRVPLAGGPSVLVVEADNFSYPRGFVVRGEQVLFLEYEHRWEEEKHGRDIIDVEATEGRLVKVAGAGGKPTRLARQKRWAYGYSIAIVGDRVLWSDDGALLSMPLGGGKRRKLKGAKMVRSFVVDGDRIYALTYAYEMVVLPVGGGKAEVRARGLGLSRNNDLYQDDTYLYWIEMEDLHRLPKAGGTAVVVAVVEHAGEVATDGARVYWTDQGEGETRELSFEEARTEDQRRFRERPESKVPLDLEAEDNRRPGSEPTAPVPMDLEAEERRRRGSEPTAPMQMELEEEPPAPKGTVLRFSWRTGFVAAIPRDVAAVCERPPLGPQRDALLKIYREICKKSEALLAGDPEALRAARETLATHGATYESFWYQKKDVCTLPEDWNRACRPLEQRSPRPTADYPFVDLEAEEATKSSPRKGKKRK